MKFDEYKEKYLKLDDRFFAEVFIYGEYDPVREMKKLDTIVDVGALAGEFSFWVQNLGAKNIYAIEGDPDAYKELEENIKEFEFDRVKPFYLALGRTNRTGHITVSHRGGGLLSGDISKTDRDVEVQTLATFMNKNKIKHIDLLKIDIEQGETDVFSAEDFASVADKIDRIMGEHVCSNSKEILERYGFMYEGYGRGCLFSRT